MKKLLILLITIPILFISCTAEDGIDGIDGVNGTDGIDGIDGVDGIDGIDGIDGVDGAEGIDGVDGTDGAAQVFQVNVDFNADNNFEKLIEFPTGTIFNLNSIVVAYRLVEIIIPDYPLGMPPPPATFIWETIPSILYLEDETLYYGFKNSFKDILLYMDGSMNLMELPSEFTQDVVFRIAILQADLISSVDANSVKNIVSSMQNNQIIFLK